MFGMFIRGVIARVDEECSDTVSDDLLMLNVDVCEHSV